MRAFFLVALLLAGCMLKQEAPKPTPPPVRVPITGVVAIEDLVAPGATSALFYAAFRSKPQAQATARQALLATVAARPDAAPVCQIVNPQQKTGPRPAAWLSVGTLVFGPALQTTGTPVEPNDEHRYIKKLDPGFPAGVYNVAAKGLGDTPGFSATFSMPEAVSYVSLGGVRLDSGALKARRNEPLVFGWRTPAVAHEANLDLIEIEGKRAGGEAVVLRCAAREMSVPVEAGDAKWVLTPDLASFAPKSRARMFFLRAHIRDARSTYVDVQLQGLRTHATMLDWED